MAATGPDGPASDEPFVLLRAALLAVPEATRLVGRTDADEGPHDPLVATAVALASGHQLLDDAARGRARARSSVARYVARMGGRATPYGAFAGVALGEVGPRRDLRVGDRDAHRVRVRVDIEALHRAVADATAAAPPESRPLRRNPSARAWGPAVRLHRSGDASAAVVTVRRTPVVDDVLELLGARTTRQAELIEALHRRRPAATPEALARFLQRLVDNGLLLVATDLLAPDEEPAQRAEALLRTLGATAAADALAALGVVTGGDRPLTPDLPVLLDGAWRAAAAHIPAFVDVPPAHRYHLDTGLALDAGVLDRRTVTDLERALRHVHGFAAGLATSGVPGAAGRAGLDDLRDALRARHEDAEVPLLAALDLETGVRPAAARSVSKIASSAGVRRGDAEDALRVHPVRLRVLDRFLRTGAPVDLGDVAGLVPAPQHGARSVQAVLLDDYEGRYRAVLVGGAGRSPLALISRFCLGRPTLTAAATAWARPPTAPTDGDPLHVELVYDPGGRIANVLVRPRLTDEVVALDGAAGGTFSLDRLQVRVDGDALRLRDAATGRPVVIELNTAHNVDMPGQDPLYGVLGHLSSPGGVSWTWGGLRTLAHLPRVTCGSVIVAAEQWCLSGADVRSVLDADDPAARLRELLPGIGARRFVGTGVFDHVLPLDLTSPRSVTCGLERSAGGDDVEIMELPQLEAPAAVGPAGGHVAEVVVALPQQAPRPAPARIAPYDPAHGAAWLYTRYYTGVAAADVVAARAGELAARLTARGTVDGWFFLRYVDDGLHVRVRMRPSSPHSRDEVGAALAGLGAELRDAGLVTRVVHDDYVPEVARYGGPAGVSAAERLFAADSTAVAALVAGAPAEDVRLRHAVAAALRWAAVVGAGDPSAEQDFLRRCSEGLGLAFTPSGNAHGRLYREQRAALSAFVATAEPDPATADRLLELAGVVAPLGAPWSRSVLGSALHLHCNRLFAFDANRMEYLCYDFARRLQRERRARSPR